MGLAIGSSTRITVIRGKSISSAREIGIDAGRIVACFAVVMIHVRVKTHFEDALWAQVWFQITRFAVPFFFIAAGYFARIPQRSFIEVLKGSCLRLLLIYVVWTTIYSVIYGLPRGRWNATLLYEGGRGFHLWFLVSLALALAMASALYRAAGWRGLIAVTAAIYLFGIAFGPYSTIVLGFDFGSIFNTRNGPFFALPFVTVGVLLKATDWKLSTCQSLALFAGGFVLQTVEAGFLKQQFGIPPFGHDFIFSTMPFGIGAFLFFREAARWRFVQWIGQFGYLTLGIYCVHLIAVRAFLPDRSPDSIQQAIFVSVAAFLASWAAAWLVRQRLLT